jgi:four helix bundle protein
MSIQGLERLQVWRRAKDFALVVYRQVLPLLPGEEKWGLEQQIRRAVQSIPANIAEGYGRFYYQDNVRFCYIARGSLDETASHLVLAHELGFVPDSLFDRLAEEGEELVRLLNGYIAYLKRSRQGENEPGADRTLSEPIEAYTPETPSNNVAP